MAIAPAAMRQQRVAITMIATTSLLAACGFAFSPGDYNVPSEGSPSTITADGSPTPSTETSTTTPPDTGADAAPPNTRVLVIGGRREAISGEPNTNQYFVAETMKTTLLPTGELTEWTYDIAPPQSTTWAVAETLNGSLLIQAQGGTTAYMAPFTDHITGEWTSLALRGNTPEQNQRAWMFEQGLLSAGGFTGPSSATGDVYFASFNFGDGGINGWQEQTPKLVRGGGDVTLLRTAKYIYAIGGRDNNPSNSSGRNDVEVASLDPSGLPQTFQTTTALANPYTDGGSIGLITPPVAVGDGYVFVVGGAVNNFGGYSDVAMASKIDDATGLLGPWIALPKLPAPTENISLLFVNDRLYAFGGQTQAGPFTDDVLSLQIQNGTPAAEWTKAGTLPNRRSGLVTMVY